MCHFSEIGTNILQQMQYSFSVSLVRGRLSKIVLKIAVVRKSYLDDIRSCRA